MILLLLFLFLIVVAVRGASRGQTLTAPLVLQEGDWLENCVGDRAGVMSGLLSVSDGTAPGQFLFRLTSQGAFAALVVDASGNVFLQRTNQQTFLLTQGEGPANTYRLFLNEKAELTVVSQLNEIYFQTEGRAVPRACPVLGCETIADGDCRGCLSSPDGAKCIYCSKQKTCFATPTFICPSTDVTFTAVAQCGTTTTTTRSLGATPAFNTPAPTPPFTVRAPPSTTTLVFKTRAPATGPTFTIRPVQLTLAKQLFTQAPDDDTSVVDEPSGLQEGVIIGIAVGAALFVCLVLLLMGFLIFRMFRAGNARRHAMTISNQAFNPHMQMQMPMQQQQSFVDMFNQPTNAAPPVVAAATAGNTVKSSRAYVGEADIMFSARDADAAEEPEFQVYGVDNSTVYAPATTRKATAATHFTALRRQESAPQHYGLSNLGIETQPSQGVTYGLEAQAGSYGAATLATSGHKPDF